MRINITSELNRVAPVLIEGEIYQHDDGRIFIYTKPHNDLVDLGTGKIYNYYGGYGEDGSKFTFVSDKYEIVKRNPGILPPNSPFCSDTVIKRAISASSNPLGAAISASDNR